MTNMPRMRRRSFTVLIGALVAVLLFAGTAVGVLVTFSGGRDLATQARSQTSQFNTSSQLFITLSSLTYTVASGTSRFFDARFTGESLCSGTANNICIVRVVARNDATGAISELNPQSSPDFAFDQVSSSGNDLNEAHAMERFIRLGSGSWTFLLQIRVSNTNSTFSIDDWSFVVDERQ
jgi:hypothetical protein